jgi:hypothetical protein
MEPFTQRGEGTSSTSKSCHVFSLCSEKDTAGRRAWSIIKGYMHDSQSLTHVPKQRPLDMGPRPISRPDGRRRLRSSSPQRPGHHRGLIRNVVDWENHELVALTENCRRSELRLHLGGRNSSAPNIRGVRRQQTDVRAGLGLASATVTSNRRWLARRRPPWLPPELTMVIPSIYGSGLVG